MLSKQMNGALGVALIAAAGITTFAVVAATGDDTSPVVVQSAGSDAPTPQPSSKPAMSTQITDLAGATCLRNQQGALHNSMFSPGYLEGPESARTPEEAIALADQEISIADAKSGTYKEDITYTRAGEAPKRASGLESRTYVGRSSDGAPRTVHEVTGGLPGGGWAATSTVICTSSK